MRRKSLLRLAITVALAITIFVGSNSYFMYQSRFSAAAVAVDAEDPPPIPQKIFLNYTFDGLPLNQTPPGWVLNPEAAGNFTVTNETANSGRNSAKFVDNSSTAVVTAFSYFAQQNGTIVVSFSVKMPNTTGNNTGLEVSVDDGSFHGSNIMFNDNAIQYFDGAQGLKTLRTSYVAGRWYGIKFIMNIPNRVYNIHIDDHLEATNAKFNGTVTSIQRIALTESNTSNSSPNNLGTLRPLAYIDDILGIQGLNVPSDFPTIQAAVNAASPGDTIVVNGSRIYFENVVIPATKTGITLEGQDVKSTIIDGKFNVAAPFCVLVNGSSNVTICGLTLRNSYKSGAQIDIRGNGSNVFANIIIAGLGSGIRSSGWNSTITDNLIQDNSIGIDLVSGKGTFVQNNTILNNTAVGLQIQKSASNSLIYGNRFVKNHLQAQDNGTSNNWNSTYPYVPSSEIGGGNYWSDFTNCTDIYSGNNQDIGPNSTTPSPDGICDQPYQTGVHRMDNYPLFLIQNVTQTPSLIRANSALQVYDKSVQYNDTVTVNVTTLQFINLINASLFVNYTLSDGSTGNMTIYQNNLPNNTIRFTIPAFKYNTTVRYVAQILADGSNWLNSTNYPIPFPYLVDDWTGPSIGQITRDPPQPDQTQPVHVYVSVTEPVNASGVDKVFLSYVYNGTLWTAQMTNISNDNYTAVIPPQPGGAPLNYTVTAIDKAGNWDGNPNGSAYIQRLGQPQLIPNAGGIPYDPCIVDFGTISGDQTYINGFYINNTALSGDDSLGYSIQIINDGSWFSLNATTGVLAPGQRVNIKVTVDTNKIRDALDSRVPGRQDAELQVSLNGTIVQWGVVIRINVMDIIIDESAVYPSSSESPNRVNIGSNQTVAFHAEWAINCLSATNGILTLGTSDKKPQTASVNNTGWALFSVSRSTVGSIIFWVNGVQFGNVTSFWQTAQNRTIIWERVNITLSMANDYVDVGSPASISWDGSTYESDKTPFEGLVLFNDSLVRDHVDEASISASSIIDYAYPNVTVFESNSVNVIWDEIRIIQGGVSNPQANSGQIQHVWFIAIYERENTLFKGENGTLILNVTMGQNTSQIPLDWSFDGIWNWRQDFNYSSGTVTFQVSEVNDYVHHLTKIRDGVGPLNITWGQKPWWEGLWPASSNTATTNNSNPNQSIEPAEIASSSTFTVWATVLVAVALAGIVLSLVLVGAARKSKRSKSKKKNSEATQGFKSASRS